jgi:hypothetical protein
MRVAVAVGHGVPVPPRWGAPARILSDQVILTKFIQNMDNTQGH